MKEGTISKLTGSNNVCVGYNAGLDLTDESNIVIIGDNIKKLDHSQENVLFLGTNVAIGEYIGGIKINLKDVITSYYELKNN